MQTKQQIINFFTQFLPEYCFVYEKKPNLIFRSSMAEGLFHFFAVQRDMTMPGLAIEVATTYNPVWKGEHARPLGVSTGLANLKLGRSHQAIRDWMCFEPSSSGLNLALQEICNQYIELTQQFFNQSDQYLKTNRLLQLAILEAKSIPEVDRTGIQTALNNAGGRVGFVNHPTFICLREKLRTAWTSDTTKEERRWTSRLAYDALIYLTV